MVDELKTLKDIFFGFNISELFMVNNIKSNVASDICAKIISLAFWYHI